MIRESPAMCGDRAFGNRSAGTDDCALDKQETSGMLRLLQGAISLSDPLEGPAGWVGRSTRRVISLLA